MPPALRTTVFTLVFVATFAGSVHAQVFVKQTDVANPVVADPGAPGFAGASWIDADGDGWPDLFVGDRGLYQNLGNGSFARIDIPGNEGTLGHSWGDIDNDGDADLYACGGLTTGSRFFRNDGGGAFTRIVDGLMGDSLANVGWSCAFGDYDADGFLDLAIARPTGFIGTGPNRLLHNLGDGTFEAVLGTDVTAANAPFTIPSWSDFDLDGDLDLSIGAGPISSLGPDYFYRNLLSQGGTPILQRITAGALATDLRDGQIINWIDYDNDRDIDCSITNYNNRANSLYRNDNGTYVRMTGAQAGAIVTDIAINTASVWNDYDNDGDLDCVVTRTGASNRYYRNQGGGVFQAVSLGALTSAGANTAVAADYDHDGDVDLYVSAPGPAKGLFRNDLAAGRHWIEFDLRGATSNRSAIGARVQVRAVIGGVSVWQMREVSAQNSFDGHSSFVVHFGLGDATAVEELRITWPRGLVETVAHPPIDTIHRVTEGQAITTPTAVALTSAVVTGQGVELTWHGAGLAAAGASVERRPESGDWQAIGSPDAIGGDRLAFVDVAPAGRWAYRLTYRDERGPAATEAVWVEVPALRRSFAAVAMSGGRQLRLLYELPRAGDATLELLDSQGRIVVSRALGSRPAGRGEERVDIGGVPVGVYWARLLHDRSAAVARVLVLR